MMDEGAMQVECVIDDESPIELAAAAAAAEEAVMVDGTTLDLDQYVTAYSGHNRKRRLLFIAKKCPDLKIHALKICMRDFHEAGIVTAETQQVALQLSDACMAAGCPDEAEPIPTDADMARANALLMSEREALETQLKQARGNMVKESIRVGFMELGHHFHKVCDFSAAMKAFLRCRDYSTSAAHVVEWSVATIRAALQVQNWTNIHNHVNKATGAGSNEKDFPGLRTFLQCAGGLAHLSERNYERAASSFLQADIEACDVPDLLSRCDVATCGCLCALATFSRGELKKQVLDNSAFKEFMELYPQIRETVKLFAASKYGDCLKMMDSIKSELLLDCYMAPHVTYLFKKIREKMISQYFSPFSSVDLNKMASDFGCTVSDLETELTELIAADVIQARIDSDKQILYARQVNIRARTFRKAMEVGTAYRIHTQAVLLRAAMLKANMSVGGSSTRGPSARGGAMMDPLFDADL
mmetsp:Transcript_16469/g.48483  ORF Transcript_16469/g.48483 Transcript_16469/m.48483 type:complete len:471 (+) Transcript_16469:3-1415(+)